MDTLTLLPYHDSDWPALAELLSDRRLLLSLYPQRLGPPALNRVEAEWRFPPSGSRDFQLVVRLDEQGLVGCVRLERRQLSYFLGRACWGRGLGGRMLALVTDQLRATWPGEQFQALVARDNVASCRILLQNGFTFSGNVPGPSSLRCWQAFTYRAECPAAASQPAEELEQAVVDRR